MQLLQNTREHLLNNYSQIPQLSCGGHYNLDQQLVVSQPRRTRPGRAISLGPKGDTDMLTALKSSARIVEQVIGWEKTCGRGEKLGKQMGSSFCCDASECSFSAINLAVLQRSSAPPLGVRGLKVLAPGRE